MIVTDLHGDQIEITAHMRDVVHCTSCLLPMYLIYNPKVRSICHECGGVANPDLCSRTILEELLRERVEQRRAAQAERLATA